MRSPSALRRRPPSSPRPGALRRLLPALALLVVAVGCGGGGEGVERGGEGSGRAPEADDVPTARETGESEAVRAPLPSGGLEGWASDLRDRLEDVELDPRNSHEEVRYLYRTHHALIERYYGEGGEVTGNDHPELARAVARQDTAFQELLELTGTSHYIERSHLLHAIRNIRVALRRTLALARESEVSLEP